MNAKEFMIGDWVRDAGITSRPVYKRINRVDERENDCVADDYKVILGEAGMEPIRLTPEILEANRFERLNNGEFHLLGQYYCFITQMACYLEVLPSLMDEKATICSILYVHEFQHFLRLIGEERLADNFVIEKGGAK